MGSGRSAGLTLTPLALSSEEIVEKLVMNMNRQIDKHGHSFQKTTRCGDDGWWIRDA